MEMFKASNFEEDFRLFDEYINSGRSQAFYNLESLCICFPGRLTGSDALESSLDFLTELGCRYMNLPNLKVQSVCVPCWDRGNSDEEKLVVQINPGTVEFPLPNPTRREIMCLANGMSIGANNVKGKIIVVKSFEELKILGGDNSEGVNFIYGNIVLIDYSPFVLYKDQTKYRGYGPIECSKYGAVACITRSLAPNNSTSGIHTGTMHPFPEDMKAIPAACISIEDSDLLTRLNKRGYELIGELNLPCSINAQRPTRMSRNIIFEIEGNDNAIKNQVVLLGAHTDSWDCQHNGCQGAHDDGQGVIILLELLRIIKELNLKPRRTIRIVLFVDEEVRQSGAQAYCDECSDHENIIAAIETDLGAGPVIGWGFTGSNEGRDVLREIISPLNFFSKDKIEWWENQFATKNQDIEPSNIKNILTNEEDNINRYAVNYVDEEWEGWGIDTRPLIFQKNIPGILLRHNDTFWNNDYFHHHHTLSDSINNVDPKLLELNLKILISTAWLLANHDKVIPRKKSM